MAVSPDLDVALVDLADQRIGDRGLRSAPDGARALRALAELDAGTVALLCDRAMAKSYESWLAKATGLARGNADAVRQVRAAAALSDEEAHAVLVTLSAPVPVEIKTKTTASSQRDFRSDWSSFLREKRHGPQTVVIDEVAEADVPDKIIPHKDWLVQLRHECAVFGCNRGVFVVAEPSRGSILAALVVRLEEQNTERHCDLLREHFFANVKFVHDGPSGAPFASNLPDELRDFGFSKEKSAWLARTHRWRALRAYVENGHDAQHADGAAAAEAVAAAARPAAADQAAAAARPVAAAAGPARGDGGGQGDQLGHEHEPEPRRRRPLGDVKLMSVIALMWNMLMGFVDVTNRLARGGTPTMLGGLPAAAAVEVKKIMLELVNVYRVWQVVRYRPQAVRIRGMVDRGEIAPDVAVRRLQNTMRRIPFVTFLRTCARVFARNLAARPDQGPRSAARARAAGQAAPASTPAGQPHLVPPGQSPARVRARTKLAMAAASPIANRIVPEQHRHWSVKLSKSNRRRCVLCNERSMYFCPKCEVVLCADFARGVTSCYHLYHSEPDLEAAKCRAKEGDGDRFLPVDLSGEMEGDAAPPPPPPPPPRDPQQDRGIRRPRSEDDRPKRPKKKPKKGERQ